MVSPVNEPGFLTKIVKRIRDATQDGTPGEEAADAAQRSANAIREQKRRDDAVRRREFNHLRQVRALRIKDSPDHSMRLSVFQNSSTFSADGRSIRGRAKTVKKIDAIEAELAQQWWSNNNGAEPEVRTPQAFVGEGQPDNAAHVADVDLDFTAAGFMAQSPTIPTLPLHDALGAALDLFEQGQHTQAETALVALLQSPQLDNATAQACSAALLDLYRATGARANFDTVAIEYAQLFGRSAPEWRHTAGNDAAIAPAPNNDMASPQLKWECPHVFSAIDMITLQGYASPDSVTVFDWSAVQSIEPQAAPALLTLFSEWARQTTRLHFKGSAALQAALAALTPVGVRSTDALCWRLRLEVLRVLDNAPAFEDAAMEYCVTYEISPPAWLAPRCRMTLTDALPCGN